MYIYTIKITKKIKIIINFDDNDHYDFERTNRIFNTIGFIGIVILAITVITLIILIS